MLTNVVAEMQTGKEGKKVRTLHTEFLLKIFALHAHLYFCHKVFLKLFFITLYVQNCHLHKKKQKKNLQHFTKIKMKCYAGYLRQY